MIQIDGRHDMTTDWAYKATTISRPLGFGGFGLALFAFSFHVGEHPFIQVHEPIVRTALAAYGLLLIVAAFRPRRWVHTNGIWLAFFVFSNLAAVFATHAFRNGANTDTGFWLTLAGVMAGTGGHMVHSHLIRLGKTL